MENSVSERIKLIIKEKKLNISSFSKAIGLTNNVTIGRILEEKREPSYKILHAITQTFGSIDANWLLTGTGTMYKDTSTVEDLATIDEVSFWKEKFEDLREEHMELLKENNLLLKNKMKDLLIGKSASA